MNHFEALLSSSDCIVVKRKSWTCQKASQILLITLRKRCHMFRR
jgi:hypothetical protein